MAGIIDGRKDIFDDTDVEEVEETEVVDNDDGIDLDGGQAEDVDADLDFEDETEAEDSEVEQDEKEDNGDDLDEPESNEEDEKESEEESNQEEDEEIDQEDTQVSAKDAKIAELERQHEADAVKHAQFQKQVKEALEMLGIKVDGDVTEALDRIAAETEGKTLEQYRREKDEQAEIEKAKQELARQRFEQLAANDLAEIKKSFPDLLKVDNIRKLFNTKDDFVKFGRLRDSGIDPKTAYMAVNGEQVRTAQAQAAQKKVAGNGKGHITSVAPKKASDNSVYMPKETLKEWRDTFPNLSDKEIHALYKQTL